jgi:hypothetical protein
MGVIMKTEEEVYSWNVAAINKHEIVKYCSDYIWLPRQVVKGNRGFAYLRYWEEDSISPSRLSDLSSEVWI